MKQWELRIRENNWPDQNTIKFVMDTGCDIILTPPQCAYSNVSLEGNTSVMRIPRMLISFSKAEVILVNSWTLVQQIVYYMLRRLAKTELHSSTSSLCNYHIKTLMLWSMEDEPTHWWVENRVIAVCCHLLDKLGDMVDKKSCPNYFLPDVNLFELFDSDAEYFTREKIRLFCNRDALIYWFSTCGIEQEEILQFPQFTQTVKRIMSSFSSKIDSNARKCQRKKDQRDKKSTNDNNKSRKKDKRGKKSNKDNKKARIGHRKIHYVNIWMREYV